MDKLMQHTGGSIALMIISIIILIAASIVAIVSLFTSINKNQEIPKTQKVEYNILVISVIINAMVVSGMIGYYWCMYIMLQ